MKTYDVFIIGGGPSGLSAAIYAARSGVSVCVAEEFCAGGMSARVQISNYPGYTGSSGFELAQNMCRQAQSFGAEIVYGKVESIDFAAKTVMLGEPYGYKSLVIATGNTPRKLNVAREDELTGQGVSYCAACDGNFFKGRTVTVTGAGRRAREAADYLCGLAAKVYVISDTQADCRAEVLRGRVTQLIGSPLSAVVYECDGEAHELKTDGLFVEMGYTPSVNLVRGVLKTDEGGFIITDGQMRTSAEGVYAAGDVRASVLKQAVTAAADGAIAGTFAAAYAKKHK